MPAYGSPVVMPVRQLCLAALATCTLATACRDGSITLNASGATFQQGAQEVSIEAFRKTHRDIKINYGGGGSGKGRQDFADRVVDFACTDAPYEPKQLRTVEGEFFYIPNVLGAITVSFNVPGISALRFTAPTLAKIFQRDITAWNDPAIAADNPGVALPALDIVVARRSDGSGTTANFTKYLTLAAPGVWRLASGSTVAWPADTRAGHGNGGVSQLVEATPGAIGYVDLSDAKASGLHYASIRNRAGRFVLPTTAAATAAAERLDVGDDLLFSALDAPTEDAYPITAQSWCMAYRRQADPAKGAALVAYFRFMLTDAQALLDEVDFAPIPPRLRAKALARIDQIEVPG